ncbi:hypothetical protein SUGI_0651660 [Cryptomeria japonica]|nr:hypothetical protein SUGI_0651660 [Cryptomeria japonica]
MEFLKNEFQSQDVLGKALLRAPRLFNSSLEKILKPSLSYWIEEVARSRTKMLEAKIENLKLCGLSAEETWQLLGAAPLLFLFSKESVSEKMNFLVTNMELPANYVVKHPSLSQVSLEKTMKPRFLVWQKIKSINDSELPLLTVFTMTEARFVYKIIKEHLESKILWTIYENAISNASNRPKSTTKQTFVRRK